MTEESPTDPLPWTSLSCAVPAVLGGVGVVVLVEGVAFGGANRASNS